MLKSLLIAVTFPILVLLVAIVANIIEELENHAIHYSFSGRSANPLISGAVYLVLGAVIGAETADPAIPQR